MKAYEHDKHKWNKMPKANWKVPWLGFEPKANLKLDARQRPKRGRFTSNPRRMHSHAKRESAGKTQESAGKSVAKAMKVAVKSAGNFPEFKNT